MRYIKSFENKLKRDKESARISRQYHSRDRSIDQSVDHGDVVDNRSRTVDPRSKAYVLKNKREFKKLTNNVDGG